LKRIIENVKYCHVDYEDDRSFIFDHVHIKWNEQISFHQSEDWEISYIITGSGTRIIGDFMETFSRGEIIVLPPNVAHGWYFDQFDHDKAGKIENITVIFPDSLLIKYAELFPEAKRPIAKLREINKGLSLSGDVLRKVEQLMLSMTEQSDMERISTLLLIFAQISSSVEMRVVGYNRKQSKTTLRLQEINRFILNNYTQKITLDEIANYVGMNTSSFCSFFKREKGQSFFSALNEYRINCSCLMLRETSKSIAEIGYAVGFNDIPYFNRTFKKFKTESPLNYRIRHNNLT